MANKITQILIALILIVLAVVLLNPTGMFMPSMMVVGLMASTLAAFALFASVVVREQGGDEREVLHRAYAGRVAFLVGSALLTLGIVVEAWTHSVDPWLVYALIAMVLAKLGTRLYADLHL